MNYWIDLSALWRIVVAGLVFGAGLPALFGVGLRLLSGPSRPGLEAVHPAGPAPAATITRNPVAVAAAALCFAVVLGAIGWGVYLIVDGG